VSKIGLEFIIWQGGNPEKKGGISPFLIKLLNQPSDIRERKCAEQLISVTKVFYLFSIFFRLVNI